MAYTADGEYLNELIAALKSAPSPRDPSAAAINELRGVADRGWIFRPDLEDLLMVLDPRLNCYGAGDLKRLVPLFNLQWQLVAFRPNANARDFLLYQSLSAAHFAFLLIKLKELGFRINPEPLVQALLPKLKSAQLLEEREVRVLWYDKTRRRNPPLVISNTDRRIPYSKLEAWKTEDGYKVEVWGDPDEGPAYLEVKSPHYRRPPERVEVTCADCGHTYFRGDPESSAYHRTEHKRRMYFLKPKPLARFLISRQSEANPELVVSRSPAWKHNEMYIRALAFKREFRFDFVQWKSRTGNNDHAMRGFLFGDELGAIVGACAFRDRGGRWGLQWVWLCPEQRGKGHLAQRWPFFRKEFGDFLVEGPVSPGMQRFLEKQGDSRLMEGRQG